MKDFSQHLYQISRRGVKFDYEEAVAREASLSDQSFKLASRLINSVAEALNLRQEKVNLNSSNMMSQFVYSFHEIDPKVFGISDGPTLDLRTLEKLSPRIPELQDYVAWRKLNKRHALIANLIKCVGADGRIHATFKNGNTLSGTVTSIFPNLSTVEGDNKDLFTCEKGNTLVALSFSNLAYILVSNRCDQENKLNEFVSNCVMWGVDIHTAIEINTLLLLGYDAEYATSLHLKGMVNSVSGVIQKFWDHLNPEICKFRDNITSRSLSLKSIRTLAGREISIEDIRISNVFKMYVYGSVVDVVSSLISSIEDNIGQERSVCGTVIPFENEILVEVPDSMSHLQVGKLVDDNEFRVPIVYDMQVGKVWR